MLYRGRFAPSPTGPLHFGSLVAAVASYLDARANDGTWLIRIDDIDTPRIVPGAAEAIVRALAAHGMESDEAIVTQSQRLNRYEAAFKVLVESRLVYPCTCSRREIADSAVRGIEGPVYPEYCRAGSFRSDKPAAWRLRTDDNSIVFRDGVQGDIAQRVRSEVGDFIVKRADGRFAYQLVTVVDDAEQSITNIVRGADLLHSTPRQIFLQTLLRAPRLEYAHVPVVVNASGEKLSKQSGAAAVDVARPERNLRLALHALGFDVPRSVAGLRECWDWATATWAPAKVRRAQVVEWPAARAGKAV